MTPHPISAQVWTAGEGFALVGFGCEIAGGRPLVALDLASVCGSDAHTVLGRRSAPSPSILGHEAVGRLVSDVTGLHDVTGRALADGDRVVWTVTATCGVCDRCARGLTAKCRHVLKTGHEPLTGPWPLSGGYASHLALHPGLALVHVPDTVPDGAAAMASCALATVMACREASSPWASKRVLVIGAGMLGLCAIAVAQSDGAGCIAALDASPSRTELARRHGADAMEAEATMGGFDVVVELSGSQDGVRQALAAADLGATIVLAGSVTPVGHIGVDPEKIVRSWLTIRGVHNYEPRHLAEAIEFLARPGAPTFADVITPPVALADLPTLFGPSEPGVLRRTVTPHRR